MRRSRVIALCAAGLALSSSAAYAVASNDGDTVAACTSAPVVTDNGDTQSITVTCDVPKPPATTETVEVPGPTSTVTATETATATATETVTVPGPTQTVTVPGPTVTVTASPSPSSSPTPTRTPTPTPTPTPSVTPTPTPTVTPTTVPSGFPDAASTGYSGTLGAYTGPCSFPANAGNVLIDSKNVAAKCSELIANQNGITLTIKNSLLPRVEMTDPTSSRSMSISDSTINASGWLEGAVWGGNFTLTRVEVTGGQHSVHCQDNCTVTDSWLHGQYNPAGGSTHNNGFITNGGQHMVIRHNTLYCDPLLNSTGGGCSGDLSLFGDFEQVNDVVVDGNLLKANNSSISYCLYAGYQPTKKYPTSTNVRITNNVFERGPNRKCGVYGPVTSYTAATGNTWSGNTWDDGTTLNP